MFKDPEPCLVDRRECALRIEEHLNSNLDEITELQKLQSRHLVNIWKGDKKDNIASFSFIYVSVSGHVLCVC